MKKMFMVFTAAVFSVAMVASASADIVFSNDFESETLDTVPAGFDHTGGTGSYTQVKAGQVLELASRSDTGNYAFGNFDGTTVTPAAPGYASVTTFSFDAIFSNAAASQLRMRARDTAFVNGATDTVRFDLNAAVGVTDSLATYDYVINNSTLAVAAAPKTGTAIAAGSYEIFRNGASIASGSNFTAADDLAVDKLTLWVLGDTGGSVQGIVQIDNFSVNVTSAVPEPGSLALLGLGALGLVARRRR